MRVTPASVIIGTLTLGLLANVTLLQLTRPPLTGQAGGSSDSCESHFTEYNVPLGRFDPPGVNPVPLGITIGSDGNIWFTKGAGYRIGKMTPDGQFSELAIRTYPNKITTGPDGNIWLTENVANTIARISTNGSLSEFPVPSSESFPEDIIAGPDGNLWFTEVHGNRIGRITPAGVITEFLISGEKIGTQPSSITAGPDGNLWFTERQADRIGRITPAGVVTEFPLSTAGNPSVHSRPVGIAAGPDGNLWFTEYSSMKIGRITTGGVITEFPIPLVGRYTSQWSHPTDIILGPDGNLWFVNGHGLSLVTPDGVIKEVNMPPRGGVPLYTDITLDANGIFWLTDQANPYGKILKFDPNGFSCFIPHAVDDSASTEQDTPVIIHVLDNDTDPDGNPLTVTSVRNLGGGTAAINPDGTVTYTPYPDSTDTDAFQYTIANGHGGTSQATVTVTISESSGGSDEGTTDGNEGEDTGTDGNEGDDTGTDGGDSTDGEEATDGNDTGDSEDCHDICTVNLQITCSDAGATITGRCGSDELCYRCPDGSDSDDNDDANGDGSGGGEDDGSNTGGGSNQEDDGSTDGTDVSGSCGDTARIEEFPIPSGNAAHAITVGPDGNLWFTEIHGNRIGRITPSGVITEFPVPTAGSAPWDITAHTDGNLWFTEQVGNRIARITPSGTITEFPQKGDWPAGIASGSDGAVWYTHYRGSTIGRMTSDGTEKLFPKSTETAGPLHIVAGPDSNLWFAELENMSRKWGGAGKIGRVATDGTVKEFATYPPNITKVVSAADGTLRYVDTLGQMVTMKTDGTIASTSVNRVTEYARDITIDREGTLWTAARGIGRLQPGAQFSEFPTPGDPRSLTIAPDGSIWFAEGKNIAKLTVTGEGWCTSKDRAQTDEEREAMNPIYRNQAGCFGATIGNIGGISDDGKTVLFSADYDNLVGDVNGEGGSFLYDAEKKTMHRISISGARANVSGDGRYVTSCAYDYSKYWEYDRETGKTVGPQDGPWGFHADLGNRFTGGWHVGSPVPSIDCRLHKKSANGEFILCETYKALLPDIDKNNRSDVYTFAMANPQQTLRLISMRDETTHGFCSWDNGEAMGTSNGKPVDGGTPVYRPLCGNDRLDQGERCDEGSRNADTQDAVCGTNCLLTGGRSNGGAYGYCGDTGNRSGCRGK